MPNWKIINATFWVIFKHCEKCHNCHFFECYEVLIFGQFLTKLYVFFSADWLHDYRLHGMGSIHFCDSQSVPGRNFGKISKWPYVMSYHMLKSTFLHFFQIFTYVVIGLGFTLFFSGLIGWVGGASESPCLVRLFLFSVVVSMIAEIGGIISLNIVRLEVHIHRVLEIALDFE